MDGLSFFVLNIFINSLLTFFTTFLLVEIVIGLFRIKQGRSASYLRMIPIVKLFLDFFLYDFSRWAYLAGVNPSACEEGSRMLSAIVGWRHPVTEWLTLPIMLWIEMTAPGNLTFTVADIIGYSIPIQLLRAGAFFLILTTAAVLIKRLVSYFFDVRMFNQLRGHSPKKIRNIILRLFIKKHSLNVIVMPNFFGSPFVTGLISSRIVLPQHLSTTLSQREYEAVLAHEIEHIRYKDNLVRFILTMICSIFWWVPTAWLKNRVEEGLEIGCDHHTKKYQVDPLNLASAICKTAKNSVQVAYPSFAYHLAKGNKLHKRIELLLDPAASTFTKTRFILIAIAACVAFFGIFFGRYWIF